MTTIRIQAKGAMLAAMAVCAFLVAGCQGHTPQAAAENYLGNLKLYNYPATYEALSHQDQVDRTMDQFLSEIPMAPDVSKDWFKGILRTYDYKVGDAKIDGDKAIVTVSVTRTRSRALGADGRCRPHRRSDARPARAKGPDRRHLPQGYLRR